nr:putative colanic acid biosynthesis acetyltransferase [Sphingomonas insulae]
MSAEAARSATGGPSFSLANRLMRVLWGISWLCLARWTPPPLHSWRALILRLFGARIGKGTRIYSSVNIWLPANLDIGSGSVLGPRVRCYNQGRITIGDHVTVSQDASLCASSHDVSDCHFQLQIRPIVIENHAWIAAESFVGPGVRVDEGAVLGARGVAMRDLAAWTINSGNPAEFLRGRAFDN